MVCCILALQSLGLSCLVRSAAYIVKFVKSAVDGLEARSHDVCTTNDPRTHPGNPGANTWCRRSELLISAHGYLGRCYPLLLRTSLNHHANPLRPQEKHVVTAINFKDDDSAKW